MSMDVTYTVDGDEYEGYVAYPTAPDPKRPDGFPGMVISHAWCGMRGYIPWSRVAAPPRVPRGQTVEVRRGATAGATATWTFRGGVSRRRRGHNVEIPWRPSRGIAPRRGYIRGERRYGLAEGEKMRAEEAAKHGYVAFALDMYGKGKRATDRAGAMQLIGELNANGPEVVKMRAEAGLARDRAGRSSEVASGNRPLASRETVGVTGNRWRHGKPAALASTRSPRRISYARAASSPRWPSSTSR